MGGRTKISSAWRVGGYPKNSLKCKFFIALDRTNPEHPVIKYHGTDIILHLIKLLIYLV